MGEIYMHHHHPTHTTRARASKFKPRVYTNHVHYTALASMCACERSTLSCGCHVFSSLNHLHKTKETRLMKNILKNTGRAAILLAITALPRDGLEGPEL